MMDKNFKIIKDVNLGDDGPQVGETWQLCLMVDYGLKDDHEWITGEEHVNVSHNGDYPFFTIPVSSTLHF